MIKETKCSLVKHERESMYFDVSPPWLRQASLTRDPNGYENAAEMQWMHPGGICVWFGTELLVPAVLLDRRYGVLCYRERWQLR